MKNSLYLFLSICLLAIVGCRKELPFPDVDADDVLVLNGLISPESGVSVHLSQSCHITDSLCEQKNIENGQIILKDEVGNDLVELTHDVQGIYKADGYAIEHDKIYSIEASSSGLTTIKSKGNTPKPFNCSFVGQSEEIIANYLTWSFEVEIEDNPDEDNYYLIDGWIDILNGSHEQFELEVNGFVLPHTGHITNDVNVENNTLVSTVDILVYPLSYIFLKDETFNGTTYRLEFGIHEEDTRFSNNFDLEAHISVKSVSKELYDYYKSVALYKLTAANILAEPQQIFSNIEEGIGIFGGYTEHEFVVDLPQTEYYFPQDIIVENEGCMSPCTVKFSADAGERLNYFWDFGDGNTSTERNPEHEYQESGVYIVSLNTPIGDTSYGYDIEIEIF